MQILDYSAGKPGALAIVRAGFVGAVRYFGFPSRTKCTSREELEDFSRHGIGMAAVYEDSTGDWLGGLLRGHDAAMRGLAHQDTVGFPEPRPLYMAVDRDVVTQADFATAMKYLEGSASVLGVERNGVYGEYDVCAMALREGLVSWVWQARAWSGTPVRLVPSRHLYQNANRTAVGGIDCDINDVLQPDWGQHNYQEADVELTDKWDETVITKTPGTIGHALLNIKQNAAVARSSVAAIDTRVAALSGKLDAILGALAADEDVPLAQITAAAEAGVRQALAEGTVHVDIDVTGPTQGGA